MTIGIRLEPVDTLFLRDGTPFSVGSASQEDVGSLFPPYPPTMVGALRAAIARCKGWNGRGRWPEHVNAVLGDGPNDLGSLKFEGPIILRAGEPLFPMPRHLLGVVARDGDWKSVSYIRPGRKVVCDLGAAVRLPTHADPDRPDAQRPKPATNQWLTKTGMEAVLCGKLPEENEVVPSRKLWREEERVGLEIDYSTGTAREGRLYSTRHVRVACGVSLGVRIDGIPENWHLPHSHLVPLGGESRTAECRKWDAAKLTVNTPMRRIEASGKVAIMALTPLDLDGTIACGQAPLEAGSGLRVVSACLNRPERVGGWNSLTRRPLALRPVLSAGSVLFCESCDKNELRRLVRTAEVGGGFLRIGQRTEWGFGLVAVGAWPPNKEMNQCR